MRDQLSDMYKQKNHLNKLLACKNEKLAKIEEVHIMMREQEKTQDLHLKELASRIEDLNAEISLYQKERSKAMMENQNCRSTIEQLCKEKKQVRKVFFNTTSFTVHQKILHYFSFNSSVLLLYYFQALLL